MSAPHSIRLFAFATSSPCTISSFSCAGISHEFGTNRRSVCIGSVRAFRIFSSASRRKLLSIAAVINAPSLSSVKSRSRYGVPPSFPSCLAAVSSFSARCCAGMTGCSPTDETQCPSPSETVKTAALFGMAYRCMSSGICTFSRPMISRISLICAASVSRKISSPTRA